jgi:hypothetical protein
MIHQYHYQCLLSGTRDFLDGLEEVYNSFFGGSPLINPFLRGVLMNEDDPAAPPYDPLENPAPQQGGSDGPILPPPPPSPPPPDAPHEPVIIILDNN